MRKCAGGGDHEHKGDVTPRTETPCQRGAKRQEPREIKTDVEPVGVKERVSEKTPQISAKSPVQRAEVVGSRVVPGWDECEGQEDPLVLCVRQYERANGMDDQQRGYCREHDPRHIENRLRALCHRIAPSGPILTFASRPGPLSCEC